jgi:hypothetical protein
MMAVCLLSGACVGAGRAEIPSRIQVNDIILEIGGAPGFQISVQCPVSPSNATAINFSSRTKVLVVRTHGSSELLAIMDTTSQGKPALPTVELEPETNCKILAQGSPSDAITVHPAPYISTLEWTTNTGHGNDLEIAPQISGQDIFHFSVLEPREISAISQNVYVMHVGPTNVGGLVLIVSRSTRQMIPTTFTCHHNNLLWPCPSP